MSAIVTGGVLGGLNMNPTGLPTPQGGQQPFMTQLGQNLQAGAAKALVNTAINGGGFEKNLKDALKTSILDTIAAQAANEIGGLRNSGKLDDFTNKVAHAIAGCAVGAARTGNSSGCGPGALGAAIGELAAEAYGKRSDTVEFAAMMGAIAAALTGADAGQINLASAAGSNAAANNMLAHPEKIRDPKTQERILEAGRGCVGQASCEGVAAQADAQIKLLGDDQIAKLCAGVTQCQDDRKLERSVYVRTRDEALARLDPDAAAGKFLKDQVGQSDYGQQELSMAITRMQAGRSDESNPLDEYVRKALIANPPLFAAVLGISVIDGDSGKSSRKGLTPGQRMGESINSYYAKRTDHALLGEIDIEHIAQGHINNSGKAVGFHHEPSGEGASRVSQYTSPPDKNGVYEGMVQVQNSSGQWIDKRQPSTFFPRSWSEARLKYELTDAFSRRPLGSDKAFTATTSSGVQIRFVPPAGSVTQWRAWPIK